jgi:hypothetical protein
MVLVVDTSQKDEFFVVVVVIVKGLTCGKFSCCQCGETLLDVIIKVAQLV